MKIVNPSLEKLESILILLNREFILNKGYIVNIQSRFEGVFDKENISNLYMLEEGSRLLSFVAIKPVSIKISDKVYKVFFVGLVYTPKQNRGKGYSGYLLEKITLKYFKRDYDFGCLWTNIGEFYKKLGWSYLDNGVLVRCKEFLYNNLKEEKERLKIFGTSQKILIKVDDYRRSMLHNYTIREYRKNMYWGYNTIYNPAEKSISCFIERNNNVKGYLLGARNMHDIFIYEIITNNIYYTVLLLNYVTKDCDSGSMYFNLSKEDNLITELKKYFKEYQHQHQKLQMIKINPLNSGLTNILVNNLYISFADKI